MRETYASQPEQEAERALLLADLGLLGGERIPDLDRLTALAADVCNARLAAITVFAHERGIQVSITEGEPAVLERSATICARVIAHPEPLLIEDAAAEKDPAPVVAMDSRVRSYAGVPLGVDAALPVGVLCVCDPKVGAFSQRDVSRLQKISELIDRFLQARLARIRANRAAARTEAERIRHVQFELIFNALREGAQVYAPDGSVLVANQSAADVLGLTEDELFGRKLADPRWHVFQADGSVFPVEEFPANRALHRGEDVRDVTMGVALPSGDRRWISINAVPVHDPDSGAVDYAVVTFKDITLQRAAEDKLNAKSLKLAAALDTAEKASRAKSDFLGVMSHELRTPMNAVLGCAALLKQSRLDTTQQRTLGVLEDAGRQMLALLNDLLDMASLDAGKVRIEREPVSLVRLIEDAAVIWASEVRDKALSLAVMIDPALVAPRSVDPARVLQIIGNLMANAIKFTSQGSVTIQAWPERSRDGMDRVAIEVEDTGPGVPPEAAARIFSAFEQVDVSSKRRHGGLGLGLHVARRLALAMGGDVELENRAEGGSRFTVRINAPLAVVRPTDVAANDSEESPVAQARNVLCIDDNPRNLFVLGAVLRAAGHRVVECNSGEEGLEALGRSKFDIVLLDMVMPGMDGMDVLTHIRQAGGLNAETPVVACTANVLPDQLRLYEAAGAVGVIPKPIDAASVLRQVATRAA